MNTLNLSAGGLVYITGRVDRTGRQYRDWQFSIPLDWTTAYSEYMERG